MESKIALMKDVLTGFLDEVEEIKEQIKTKGIVPREICELCDVEDGKRTTIEPKSQERKALDRFKGWIAETEVTAISQSVMGRIFFKTPVKLGKTKPEAKDENGYIYALPDSHDTRSKKSKMLSRYRIKGLLSRYARVETCPHFDKDSYNMMRIGYTAKHGIKYHELDYIPRNLVKDVVTESRLYLCCDGCKQLIGNTGCDRVRKRGFLFDFDCPLEDIVLRRRLTQHRLAYENLEEEEKTSEHTITYIHPDWRNPVYYLRQQSSVISLKGARSLDRLRDIAKYLNLELIVSFDDHSNLPSYLELHTNMLLYNQDGLFFFDKERQPDKDMQKICEKIASSLNAYVEKERGSEHDRVVSALFATGQELGYVPQQEYQKSGVRIDCVWFDREGKIQVASEVETTSTWKKDLISTWEVEPKLAILVVHAKTDKVASNLMKSSLMKSIPHFVFYINKLTDHAFLFSKQEVIKHYDLKGEAEVKRSDIRIL